MLRADLPRTKLLPPIIRRTVERPLLVAHISAQIEAYRLTLIAAPAGSGKTTTLAAVAHALQQRPCAWLTLDADDNDPQRFVLGVVGALQTLGPQFGERALALCADLKGDESPRLLAGALVNDMAEALPQPFALALDDLHEVTNSAVYQLLDHLIERLPEQARVVVASRYDPPLSLARLRGRGQLAEFRLEALRFGLDDVRELLNRQLDLRLSDDQLARIQSRTEGWAAGLRLIGLSLTQQVPEQRAETLRGIGHDRQHIFDLLADEVLAQQDEPTQRFLLDTSILHELTPTLCEAVTGRGGAADRLQSLHRRNLFVTALDATRESYRYHALFREFLEQRLTRTRPSEVQELHLRAGQAETDATHAIHHLIAAQAWDEAARRIEVSAMQLRERGLDVPANWLNALPPTVIAERAGLSYLHGLLAEERGEFAIAQHALQRAATLYAAQDNPAMQGAALIELSAVSVGDHSRESFTQAVGIAQGALQLPVSPAARVRARLHQLWMSFYANDAVGLDASLSDVLRVVLENDDQMIARNVVPNINVAVLACASDTRLMTRFVNAIEARYGEGYGLMQVCLWELVCGLRLMEGRLPEAYDAATRAARLMDGTGEVVYVGFTIDFTLAMLALARGDWRAVEELTQRRYPIANALEGNRGLVWQYHIYLAYARWMGGDVTGLESLARGVRTTAQAMPRSGIETFVMQVEALADLAHGNAASAVRRLSDITSAPLMLAHTLPDARWLLGYALWKLRRSNEALNIIAPALASAQASGWVGDVLRQGRYVMPLLELAIKQRVQVETAQRALDLFEAYGAAQFVPVPGSGESLSPREMETLRLVATGASNADIAQQLSVTVWTVKAHLTSILAKLGATSRTQAVARARELRVI